MLVDENRSEEQLRQVLTGISHYEAKLEHTLASYRQQRAWRLMIAIRKAYDLWARGGLTGKLRAVPLLLTAPFRTNQHYPEQEIQLPDIRNYLPAEAAKSPLAPLQRKY